MIGPKRISSTYMIGNYILLLHCKDGYILPVVIWQVHYYPFHSRQISVLCSWQYSHLRAHQTLPVKYEQTHLHDCWRANQPKLKALKYSSKFYLPKSQQKRILCKICQHTGFPRPTFFLIRTESLILSGEIQVRENAYLTYLHSGIKFHQVAWSVNFEVNNVWS